MSQAGRCIAVILTLGGNDRRMESSRLEGLQSETLLEERKEER